MSDVTVTINRRAYRVACEDGQENHLRGLARLVEERVDELVGSMGQIGDQRLLVMASLLFADEAQGARQSQKEMHDKLDSIAANESAEEKAAEAQSRRLAVKDRSYGRRDRERLTRLSASIAQAKKALRSRALAQRKRLTDPDAAGAAAALLLQAIDPPSGQTVAGYAAIRGELDPRPALLALEAKGCRTVLPHTTGRGQPLRFLEAPGGVASSMSTHSESLRRRLRQPNSTPTCSWFRSLPSTGEATGWAMAGAFTTRRSPGCAPMVQ